MLLGNSRDRCYPHVPQESWGQVHGPIWGTCDMGCATFFEGTLPSFQRLVFLLVPFTKRVKRDTPPPFSSKGLFLRFPSMQPQTSGQKETPALSHLLLVIIRLDLRAQRRSQVDTFPGGNTGGIYSEASFSQVGGKVPRFLVGKWKKRL